MKYGDIIRKMESSGHYSEADHLKRSMDEHHLGEHDSVHSRDDARDGLSMTSYEAHVAERAYDDLKHDQWREQQRIEEEEQHREHLRHLQRQAERQQEEEFQQ